jgi:Isoprenylcysteine carboxyl methyltransferase (ICMT) family
MNLKCPPSAIRAWIPWIGFMPLVAMIWLLRGSSLSTSAIMALLLGVYAVPVLLLDILQQQHSKSAALPRYIAPRVVAQLTIFALILLAYWMFPYTRQQWLFRLRDAIGPEFTVPLLIFGGIFTTLYIALTKPGRDDATLHLGEMLLRRKPRTLDASVRNLLLSWLVKAFFLPLMLTFMANDINWFRGVDWSLAWFTFPSMYEHSQRLLYFCDVTIAVAGYMLTFRLFGTHIRSAEPTGLGWMVCLVCYPPFWPVFYDNFFAYENGKSWMSWMWDSTSLLHIGWGSIIIALTCIYLWATIAFGVRFSNLTHRGIITNGPYRFTKHPAYIAKNISWWMISVPFLQSSGAVDTLRLSLLMLCVNAIYYARAKTEERHLMRDPVYRDYAAWISQHGMFATLRKLLRFN